MIMPTWGFIYRYLSRRLDSNQHNLFFPKSVYTEVTLYLHYLYREEKRPKCLTIKISPLRYMKVCTIPTYKCHRVLLFPLITVAYTVTRLV